MSDTATNTDNQLQTCESGGCGRTFTPVKHGGCWKRFCSDECRAKSRRPSVARFCGQCGRELNSSRQRRYCGKRCRLLSQYPKMKEYAKKRNQTPHGKKLNAATARRQYKKHHEKLLEYAKKYRDKNKETIAKKYKEWREKNPNYGKEYYAKNRQHIRQREGPRDGDRGKKHLRKKRETAAVIELLQLQQQIKDTPCDHQSSTPPPTSKP